jgi:carboxyl-terminal processing protease
MTTFDHDDAGVPSVQSKDPATTPDDGRTPGPGPLAPGTRRRRTAGRGGLVALALAAAFGAGVGIGRVDLAPMGGGTAVASSGPAASTGPGSELALIREAWDAIHNNYVESDQLDDRELAYGAIEGLADAVGDTGHTTFLTPEERASEAASLSGSYVGIGAVVDTAPDGLPVIVGVFRGSPADQAGLKSGDIIVAVDGTLTVDEDLDHVISRVRGTAGTAVVLTIRSGADGPEREVRIIRADVHIEPVSWVMAPGSKTAVLRLEQFSTGATPKVRAALEELKAAGADRLILDLRGNPGGFVNEAVAIASEFLASGNVYVERNAKGEEKATQVSPGGVAVDLPLVVLVDLGTASSAEIVAGALQDAGRAEVVGERTFGTGTVLGEFALSDGSALRIGTVEWLTPKGRLIWHEGIAPDVVVARPSGVGPIVPDDLRSMSAADVQDLKDPQLKKALELVSD